jgi:hypothetical protein
MGQKPIEGSNPSLSAKSWLLMPKANRFSKPNP